MKPNESQLRKLVRLIMEEGERLTAADIYRMLDQAADEYLATGDLKKMDAENARIYALADEHGVSRKEIDKLRLDAVMTGTDWSKYGINVEDYK
jgi:hypothetical protein